jgi:hypothetical protein
MDAAVRDREEESEMKKAARRIGAGILVLATLFVVADVSFFYGANLGFEQGYYRGAAAMYDKLTTKI